TCGLVMGLEPPLAGCAWQPAQLFMLKRGPSPVATVSTSAKRVWPSAKNLSSFTVSAAMAPPAPAWPPRTPGSVCACVVTTAESTDQPRARKRSAEPLHGPLLAHRYIHVSLYSAAALPFGKAGESSLWVDDQPLEP